MKILVIIGSTREGRSGDKVAKWVLEQAESIDGVEYELIDLRDWILPYYNEPKHPSMLSGHYPQIHVKEWIEKVSLADGFLIVTPEYNHGYPAVLKSALDYPYKEWNNKPVGFIGYGGFAGGARAVEQLRQVVIELQMAPIKESVIIPNIRDYIEGNKFQTNDRFNTNLISQLNQLNWWARVLKDARDIDKKD